MSTKKGKKCTKCKHYMLLRHFRKDSSRGDGLSYTCKECHDAYAVVHRKEYSKRPDVILRAKQAAIDIEKTPKRKQWKKDYENTPNRIKYRKKYKPSEASRERAKRYNSKPEIKERLWEKEMIKLFNIDKEAYFKMFDSQSGKCGICEKHQSELKKRLAVDHCHETGKIRGLLCALCNSSLGMLGDNKKSILKVLNYLEKEL